MYFIFMWYPNYPNHNTFRVAFLNSKILISVFSYLPKTVKISRCFYIIVVVVAAGRGNKTTHLISFTISWHPTTFNHNVKTEKNWKLHLEMLVIFLYRNVNVKQFVFKVGSWIPGKKETRWNLVCAIHKCTTLIEATYFAYYRCKVAVW